MVVHFTNCNNVNSFSHAVIRMAAISKSVDCCSSLQYLGVCDLGNFEMNPFHMVGGFLLEKKKLLWRKNKYCVDLA